MERSSGDARPKVQRSASAAGKDPAAPRRGFQTFKILSNNYNLEATTTTDEGTASSGDNICEETTTLLPHPKILRSNPMTPPPLDPSFPNPALDSASIMTHLPISGYQFNHPRATPGSSPLMTSRHVYSEDCQFGRCTPQSIKEETELRANFGNFCPEYNASSLGNNFSSPGGVCCEDVTCDHENCSYPENTCTSPSWENHQYPPTPNHAPSSFTSSLPINGISSREQGSPKMMTSSINGKTELSDHHMGHPMSHRSVHGKYKSQGVSANFVSFLSQGTCVDCGEFEDGRYPPECQNGRQGMSFLDFYQMYGSKDSLETSKKSFNCESLMILTIISTLTCLATLLMGALSYLFLMKNY